MLATVVSHMFKTSGKIYRRRKTYHLVQAVQIPLTLVLPFIIESNTRSNKGNVKELLELTKDGKDDIRLCHLILNCQRKRRSDKLTNEIRTIGEVN